MATIIKIILFIPIIFISLYWIIIGIVKEVKGFKNQYNDAIGTFTGIKDIFSRKKNIVSNNNIENNENIIEETDASIDNSERENMINDLIETYKQDPKTIKKLSDEELYYIYKFWTE